MGLHGDYVGRRDGWEWPKNVAARANQRLKLTGAAILVLRASTTLQAAPAA
jgi:hypothetical protein